MEPSACAVLHEKFSGKMNVVEHPSNLLVLMDDRTVATVGSTDVSSVAENRVATSSIAVSSCSHLFEICFFCGSEPTEFTSHNGGVAWKGIFLRLWTLRQNLEMACFVVES